MLKDIWMYITSGDCHCALPLIQTNTSEFCTLFCLVFCWRYALLYDINRCHFQEDKISIFNTKIIGLQYLKLFWNYHMKSMYSRGFQYLNFIRNQLFLGFHGKKLNENPGEFMTFWMPNGLGIMGNRARHRHLTIYKNWFEKIKWNNLRIYGEKWTFYQSRIYELIFTCM